MDIIVKTVIPIITLIIGFFAKDIENRIGTGRAMRRAVNRAIAELLDIYTVLSQHRGIVESLRGERRLTAHGELRIREALAELLENSSDALKNYNDAIHEVASEDPVLGSELRGLHRRLWQVRSIIGQVAMQDEVADDMLSDIDDVVRSVQDNVHHCAAGLAGRLGQDASAKINRRVGFLRRPDISNSSITESLQD